MSAVKSSSTMGERDGVPAFAFEFAFAIDTSWDAPWTTSLEWDDPAADDDDDDDDDEFEEAYAPPSGVAVE
jgi:hypothetical protein